MENEERSASTKTEWLDDTGPPQREIARIQALINKIRPGEKRVEFLCTFLSTLTNIQQRHDVHLLDLFLKLEESSLKDMIAQQNKNLLKGRLKVISNPTWNAIVFISLSVAAKKFGIL
jgi:hypothetical protein